MCADLQGQALGDQWELAKRGGKRGLSAMEQKLGVVKYRGDRRAGRSVCQGSLVITVPTVWEEREQAGVGGGAAHRETVLVMIGGNTHKWHSAIRKS